jgi:glycerate-2-kinase
MAELLADQGLNWNQSHVSKAEAGHLNAILRIDVLLILASVLGVGLPELIASTRNASGRVIVQDATVILGHQGVVEPADIRAFLQGQEINVDRVEL